MRVSEHARVFCNYDDKGSFENSLTFVYRDSENIRLATTFALKSAHSHILPRRCEDKNRTIGISTSRNKGLFNSKWKMQI